jgi:hypothetical protein
MIVLYSCNSIFRLKISFLFASQHVFVLMSRKNGMALLWNPFFGFNFLFLFDIRGVTGRSEVADVPSTASYECRLNVVSLIRAPRCGDAI